MGVKAEKKTLNNMNFPRKLKINGVFPDSVRSTCAKKVHSKNREKSIIICESNKKKLWSHYKSIWR